MPLAGTAGRARPVPTRARAPGAAGPRKNENLPFQFSVKSINQERPASSHGYNEYSLLRHHIRPRFHDCPHHHEDHARLLGQASRSWANGPGGKGLSDRLNICGHQSSRHVSPGLSHGWRLRNAFVSAYFRPAQAPGRAMRHRHHCQSLSGFGQPGLQKVHPGQQGCQQYPQP